jgi:formate-dependent nitrite reductase cytochrome c552 subunit
MKQGNKDIKNITLHWRNFVIVILFILLVGIIIGLVITPHPSSQENAPPEPQADLIQAQWSHSLHSGSMGTPEERERMNQPGCAHCHTAQGYRHEILGENESDAPYTNAQGLTCFACHVEEKPVVGQASLRAGTSDKACTGCHDILVRNDGEGFSSCLQGAMLRGEGGEEFEGQVYETGKHSQIARKCVECHMAPAAYTANELKLGGHTFRVITKEETPRMFNPSPCQECHDDLTLEDVTQSQAEIRELMQELKSLLSLQTDGEPKFPKDPSLSPTQSKAAYNYHFIFKDGTWGVHNPVYIRKLLTDSIQALK